MMKEDILKDAIALHDEARNKVIDIIGEYPFWFGLSVLNSVKFDLEQILVIELQQCRTENAQRFKAIRKKIEKKQKVAADD